MSSRFSVRANCCFSSDAFELTFLGDVDNIAVDTDSDGMIDTIDLDDDGDGMSDVDEILYGFNPLY